jgi:Kef-type K+ transport system membrane component KefB
VVLGLVLAMPGLTSSLKTATAETDLFRRLFFVMTFFAIGVSSNFRKLWEEGIGRLALVYTISLFGFIIWIGLAISWIFFHGVYPPVKGG